MGGVERRGVERYDGDAAWSEEDTVAVEEPLEIRVAGDPVGITMRTPGEDRELTLGFLFAEGVIPSIDAVGSVAHCGRPTDDGFGNVIEVLPAPGTSLDPERLEGSRRGTLTTASCGTCGRRSIDDLLERVEPAADGPTFSVELLARSTEQLRAVQPRFAQTGGVHAAALLDEAGGILASAEDVGRHNAVDKVVGRLLMDGALERAALLTVSGRVSFEIVQKAAVARVRAVTAVSAPTTLAVDLAVRARLTLCAFVRGGRFNVYAGPERVGERGSPR